MSRPQADTAVDLFALLGSGRCLILFAVVCLWSFFRRSPFLATAAKRPEQH
jgi:hypothetical protein